MKPSPPPPDLFAPGLRHLFVFAHQDDELPNLGIIQRAGPEVEVAWFTNGDGLAPMAPMAPAEYALLRRHESRAAMALVRIGPERLHFFGHSELTNYALMARLGRREVPDPADSRAAFDIAASVRAGLRPLVERADVVWTQAWQGGHPEHDLTHWMTATTVAEVSHEQGRAIPLYELPAYELTILVPLRFGPWKRGVRHRLKLTAEELRLKQIAYGVYKTQLHLIRYFRYLIRLYGALSTLRGRPFGFKGFFSQEEFGPVEAGRDYTRSPHRHEAFDYIGEDYLGERIRFGSSVARFIRLAGEG
jgi:LmbE family N-acetylglucosaminyl deacetylase